jgi:acetone carboxylase gamma subunit
VLCDRVLIQRPDWPWTHSSAQADLNVLPIFLLQSLKCQEYRHISSCPARFSFRNRIWNIHSNEYLRENGEQGKNKSQLSEWVNSEWEVNSEYILSKIAF